MNLTKMRGDRLPRDRLRHRELATTQHELTAETPMPVLSETRLADLLPVFLRNREDPPPPCSVDPEAWFPERGAFSRENVIALNICAHCPYRDPCREAGYEGNEDGVWGGETSHDRARRRGRDDRERTPVAVQREQINRELTREAQRAKQRA